MEHDDKQEILESIQVILESVNEFSNSVDRRFEHLESKMVTKNYLDDKLADLKGDLVLKLRKEDQKMNRLVYILAENRGLSTANIQDVLSYKLFP